MTDREQEVAGQGAPQAAQDMEDVGVLVGLSDGGEFQLGFGTVRVGRARKANLVIIHKTVSRHHADICYESGRWVLYDKSTNGTWVNSQLVAVAQPLRTRDAVRFGEIEFRFEMRSVPKLEAAGFDPKTQPKIVPSSETFIMRSGKSKSGRPRQLFNRAAPWVVLAALIAVLVIYFFLPDLADQIIAKLPAVIREPLQSLRT